MTVGCATTNTNTDLLSAAGFRRLPADTPKKQELLKTLTPGKLTLITWKGKQFYVQPDVPNNLAFVGTPAEYQTYQQLRLAQQLSNENLMAAQMNQTAMMGWGAWGPVSTEASTVAVGGNDHFLTGQARRPTLTASRRFRAARLLKFSESPINPTTLCNLKHTHQFDKQKTMKRKPKKLKQWAVALCVAFIVTAAQAQDSPPPGSGVAGKKPNILFIMGDDIGMWNIGAYHRGLMAGRTPNLDKLAKEGMLFTDYYAEASCTAGRANFIMGQLPIRTGMTTVGQAGAKIGIPAEACTIATALKAQGYATGQFGKNHLGDLNEFLPTVHGFDEFFGYLYHLDAMEDPAHPNYPQDLLDKVGPRNMVHSWATDHGRRHRHAALGQDRQTEDRGRRNALSRTDENSRQRNPRPRLEVHRKGQVGQQAVLLLAQPNAHAHRHASFGEV